MKKENMTFEIVAVRCDLQKQKVSVRYESPLVFSPSDSITAQESFMVLKQLTLSRCKVNEWDMKQSTQSNSYRIDYNS